MEGDSHPTDLFGSVGFNVSKTTHEIYRWPPCSRCWELEPANDLRKGKRGNNHMNVWTYETGEASSISCHWLEVGTAVV